MGDVPEDDDGARHKADQELVEFLAAHGFAGPVYTRFAEEMAAYAIAVLTAWLHTGMIFVRCAEKGIKLPRPPISAWSKDDQLELALETVAVATRSFQQRLRSGHWDPGKGASLRTYFIGHCTYQFPDTYKKWLRASEGLRSCADELDERWPDTRPGPEDLMADRDHADRALASLPDHNLRAALVLTTLGYNHAEIAELIGEGATARSVEGALYRFRRKRGERS
ncbi:RNA polymerase sigma factor [Actinomadura sp. NEAU-AAG7]|uniref:RNA polymerase sigma factor n=1 Tax=Actinomadura sp. NEAU-AAG7 TaxID=2839640 RepID=UPI001BE420E7|nr:hypothetical protein [Actinomadura sp. NEAU-AAG7]MBT2213198.1 hypothetical protein [Actinomadura sp. NEAU-AAG7]